MSQQESDALRLIATMSLTHRPSTTTAPFGRSAPSPAGAGASFPVPPPPLPSIRPLAPPPGLKNSSSVADQLAAMAPQLGARAPPPSSRAPGGPISRPVAPIGARPGAPGMSRATSASPPPTGPRGAEGGPGVSAPAKRSSHEKLIEKLRGRYPDLTHSDGVRYINILREQNQVGRYYHVILMVLDPQRSLYLTDCQPLQPLYVQGKLSGMSIPTIEAKVGRWL